MIIEKYNITGEEISLSRSELEKLSNHYLELSKKENREKLSLFYLGKHDLIVDVLKLFDLRDQ